MTDGRKVGLYIHIPFCLRKCLYCDFCSLAGAESEIPRYLRALVSEMRSRPANGYTVDTVYLGGGTPSLLSPREMEGLFAALHSVYCIEADAEITCEANPGTVTEDKLSAYRSLGINRLSLGVQSLSPRALSSIGRAHTAEEAVEAFRAARIAGFANISLDLMTGLPGETPEELSDTVEGLLALAPEHISAYALSVEEGTPLSRSPLLATLPDEDAATSAMERTAETLERAGYLRYEISNYAKEGYESRHNLRYWRGEEYIGLGPAAYSYFGGERFGNARDVQGYMAGIRKRVDGERITREEKEKETVMLSLRTAEGIAREAYLVAFGRDPHRLFAPLVARYPALFRVTPTHLSLTDRGMTLSSSLMAECLLLLEEAAPSS